MQKGVKTLFYLLISERQTLMLKGFPQLFDAVGTHTVQLLDVGLAEVGQLLQPCDTDTRQRAQGRGR